MLKLKNSDSALRVEPLPELPDHNDGRRHYIVRVAGPCQAEGKWLAVWAKGTVLHFRPDDLEEEDDS
jgi:hypothetical protein